MGYNVAVLGATGNVGRIMLSILEQRAFPIDSVYALASDKAPGREVSFGEAQTLPVQSANEFDFSQVDLVLASAGSKISHQFASRIAAAGAVLIDNSSAFRMDPAVPLVVPEVNPNQLEKYKSKRIIASPNCVAIPLTVALKPLHDRIPIKRVIVSTYQSVSGAGQKAMSELMNQTKASLMSAPVTLECFPKRIAFNALPHIDHFDKEGHTGEETKIIQETQKILSPDIQVAVTSVRLPVFIGHSLAVTVEFEDKLSPAQARKLLSKAPAVEVYDDPEKEHYITPLDCAGEDPVFVSRIRQDPSCERGLMMWIVADNLRKGAALNAVQIAENLVPLLK